MRVGGLKLSVILVTGASKGIGRAICELFKKSGDQVAGCSSSEATAQTIPADLKLVADVTQVEQVKRAIELVVKKWGRIDVLVNNAGLAGEDELDSGSSDDLWHRILNVNLNGTYYFSKYCLPYFPQDGGRIINIASVLGLKGVPDAAAYCAAKHGVVGMTRSLAHTLAARKITVNAVCPGWTRTEMGLSRLKEVGMKEADLVTHVPLGRFLEPSEIASCVSFLASPESRAITGQCLTVDGGVLA